MWPKYLHVIDDHGEGSYKTDVLLKIHKTTPISIQGIEEFVHLRLFSTLKEENVRRKCKKSVEL